MKPEAKLAELFLKNPPSSASRKVNLHDVWQEFLNIAVTKGYGTKQAIELAGIYSKTSSLQLPKESTITTWLAAKRRELKLKPKALKGAVSASKRSIPDELRQRIREEMEVAGWMHLGAWPAIYLQQQTMNDFLVWTGKGEPSSGSGKWVVQRFEQWKEPEVGDTQALAKIDTAVESGHSD